MIGLAQGPAQIDRDKGQSAPPLFDGFLAFRWKTLKRRRGDVGITTAERSYPRLVLSDLPSNGRDPVLFIQKQDIAVAAHQLQHQGAGG